MTSTQHSAEQDSNPRPLGRNFFAFTTRPNERLFVFQIFWTKVNVDKENWLLIEKQERIL